MQKTLRTLVLLVLMGGLAMACGPEQPTEEAGNNTTATNEDYVAPLQSRDLLFDGAPENNELPDEGKSDATYPDQFFDLVPFQSRVQSQGSRGVCSIFSAVALMEHLYITEGTITDPDFSEQFLQWSAKFEVGSFPNSSGSNSNFNLQAISRFGIPEEAAWPYETSPWTSSNDPACAGQESQQPTRCHTNGEPPQAALDAERWKLPSGRWLSTRSRDIKAFMTTHNQGVLAGGDFYYQSWNHRSSELPTNQEYWREGYVLYPNNADKEKSRAKRAGHSILLVGWDNNLEVQTVDGEGNKVFDANGDPVMEKGFFLFKNSWGTGSFGVNNPHGDGYGWISMRYVEEFKTGYVSGLPDLEREPVEEICGENLECDDPRCADAVVCTGEPQTYTSTDGGAIPDNDPDGLVSELVIVDSMSISALSVEVDIDHTYNGDLRIELEHPDGAFVTLKMQDNSSRPDVKETYRVEDFDGKDTAGTWLLIVTDTANLDVGTLNSWSLHVTP
ncbi:MAG: proprotein convertase P-domain-containing protein [Bradymonadaceae bacterium]